MIIIRMSGGIGNQMFQYALYLKLVSMGRKVKFDDVTEYALSNARPIALWVFGIEYPRATPEEIIKITDSSMKVADRIRRKLFGRRSLEYHEASTDYDSEVLLKEDSYLCGCFQSEKYFKDVEDAVRQAFRFRNIQIPEQLLGQIEKYKKQVAHYCSVSIHIRRGDYLDASEVYGGICTDAYYNKAIEYMLERYPDTHFFIFTNDTFWAEKWCEAKRLEEERFHYTVVKGTDEATGYIDLMLMSRCSHHIIANSSFSWWGAWLNESPDKCVIAPVKWLNTQECHDIYTPEMIRIDGYGKINFNNRSCL